MKMETAWDFVQEYFPNYYQSNLIAYSEDLSKLVNKELEEGDSAYSLLMKDYSGDIDNPSIYMDYKQVMSDIYEKAIEQYINNSK
jgi:hypothetical protein